MPAVARPIYYTFSKQYVNLAAQLPLKWMELCKYFENTLFYDSIVDPYVCCFIVASTYLICFPDINPPSKLIKSFITPSGVKWHKVLILQSKLNVTNDYQLELEHALLSVLNKCCTWHTICWTLIKDGIKWERRKWILLIQEWTRKCKSSILAISWL